MEDAQSLRSKRRWLAAVWAGFLGSTILAAGLPAGAQSPPPNACGTDPRYRAFDFWIGDWEVTGLDGQVLGTNRITKEADGCLILERWRSANGGEGWSMNMFDPLAGTWRQVWSSRNLLIDYAGGSKETGVMVLEGTLINLAQEAPSPFRGTWTAQEDGSVRQHFEIFSAPPNTPDAGPQWRDWFIGIYRPRAEEVSESEAAPPQETPTP